MKSCKICGSYEMTDKQYLITRAEIEELCKVLPDNEWGRSLEDMLASLPLITGNPVGKVLNRGKKILHTGWLNEVGLQLPDSTPLYTHPQPHPQPLQPITADNVTKATVKEIERSWQAETSDGTHDEFVKKAIAIAFNAVIKHRNKAP